MVVPTHSNLVGMVLVILRKVATGSIGCRVGHEDKSIGDSTSGGRESLAAASLGVVGVLVPKTPDPGQGPRANYFVNSCLGALDSAFCTPVSFRGWSRVHEALRNARVFTLFGAGLLTPPKPPTEGLLWYSRVHSAALHAPYAFRAKSVGKPPW